MIIPCLREGIATLVATQPDMALVAEAASGREAIEQFRLHQPDVTLMDVQMEEMNGIEAIIAIRAEWPARQDHRSHHLCRRRPGAASFEGGCPCLRAQGLDTQGDSRHHSRCLSGIEADRAQCRGRSRETPIGRLADAARNRGAVSGRRGQLQQIDRGTAHINEETAKTHIKSILAKLDANDRTHAVTLGLQRGVIGF